MKKSRGIFGIAGFAALMLAGAFAGCGSPSALDQCKEFGSVTCARAFECFSADVKASQAFITQFGASETECVSKFNANNCATITADKPCGDSSQTYHSDKASACLNDYRAASCTTISGGTFSSANCTGVCT